MRVLWQLNAGVEGPTSGSESDGSQEAVKILQAYWNPLLNLPRKDLIAAIAEKDKTYNAVPAVPDSRERRPKGRQVVFTAKKARLLR